MLSTPSSMSPRRLALLALAIGLSLAALIAIVALLTHSFDQTDARLIGTSLGFSVFSALGAAGAPARRRPRLAGLGVLTTAAAALSFAALTLALWVQQTNWSWRGFGVLAMISLAGSHASLVLSKRRASDIRLITNLAVMSVVAASIDAILAVIAIVGLVHHVSSDEIRFTAVLVITMLLSTALPPILRRITAGSPRPPGRRLFTSLPEDYLQRDLHAIAYRLEQLAPNAGSLSRELEREAIKLRDLASHRSRS